MFLKYPIICSHVYCYSNKSLRGGGDLEIFIRDGVTKDMVCLILMS